MKGYWAAYMLIKKICIYTFQQRLPLEGSCVGGTGQADEGVTEESTQAEAQRFLIILGLGHGERPAHCCSSLAMKEAE